MRPDCLVLSCEHATARIPRRYAAYFERAGAQLASHRGYDAGAYAVARALARRLSVPLVAGRVSRLLVDLNRSERNPAVFSRYVDALGADERERILASIHRPHREAVRAQLRACLETGRCVLHISVHSFTPVLGGVRRTADVGLLYDPARAGERAFAQCWTRSWAAVAPELRVRRNYPYRGSSDGLTTSLRREYPAGRYLGFELELNAALLVPRSRAAARFSAPCMAALVGASLGELVKDLA